MYCLRHLNKNEKSVIVVGFGVVAVALPCHAQVLSEAWAWPRPPTWPWKRGRVVELPKPFGWDGHWPPLLTWKSRAGKRVSESCRLKHVKWYQCCVVGFVSKGLHMKPFPLSHPLTPPRLAGSSVLFRRHYIGFGGKVEDGKEKVWN